MDDREKVKAGSSSPTPVDKRNKIEIPPEVESQISNAFWGAIKRNEIVCTHSCALNRAGGLSVVFVCSNKKLADLIQVIDSSISTDEYKLYKEIKHWIRPEDN